MAIMSRIRSRAEKAGRHAILMSHDLGNLASQLREFGLSDEAARIERAMTDVNKIGHVVLDQISRS